MTLEQLAAQNKEQEMAQLWSQYVNSGGDPSSSAYLDLKGKFDETQNLINNGSAGGSNTNQDTPLSVLFAEQQKKKAEQMKAQGLNPDGSPISPEFQSIANPDGTLKSSYELSPWQQVNADTGALDMYKQSALRGAGVDSPYAKLALERQQLEQAASADQAGAGASNTMLQAASRLAQSGGLGGGARERLARQGAQSGFIQRQGVERQGALDRLGIRSQDEQNRMAGLQSLQGMQNQQADIQFKNQQQAANIGQFNVGSRQKEQEAKRLFDANKYNEQMRAWAANKSADAQRGAAGGGGKK